MRGEGGRAVGEVDPLELVRRLEELPVHVERVEARALSVRVAAYPGGSRPSGIVRVMGEGEAGLGECVAWTDGDQARFVRLCSTASLSVRSSVARALATMRRATDDVYARAALEAAILDLALRQAGSNLFELAEAAERPVSFVLSFGGLGDPARALRELLQAAPAARIKLDADPAWPAAVLQELADLGRVAILDLKLAGDLRLVERAHAGLPDALLEDPRLDAAPLAARGETLTAVERAYAAGSGPAEVVGPRAAELVSSSLAARVAFDQPIRRAADLEALPLRPAAVNVKPARMGGVLEALRTVAACRRSGIATYMGGMYEVGPGRGQAQVLASLFSADAPNDVAPLALRPGAPLPVSPVSIPQRFTGLGFDEAVHAAAIPSSRRVQGGD